MNSRNALTSKSYDHAFVKKTHLSSTKPKSITALIKFPEDFFAQYRQFLEDTLPPFQGRSPTVRAAHFSLLIARTTWADWPLEDFLQLRLFDFYFAQGKGKKLRQQVIAEIVDYRLQVALQSEAEEEEFERFGCSIMDCEEGA